MFTCDGNQERSDILSKSVYRPDSVLASILTLGILDLEYRFVVGYRFEVVSLVGSDDVAIVVPGYARRWPATVCGLQSDSFSLLEQQTLVVLTWQSYVWWCCEKILENFNSGLGMKMVFEVYLRL